MHLHWPTNVKIDSDGIWWLTHSLNPEEKKKKKWGKKQHKEKKHKDSHILSNYTQGWTPMYLPSGRRRELRWKKKKRDPGIHLLCQVTTKHTRWRKAYTAICTLPHITLLTSRLDLRVTGPIPRKQEELGCCWVTDSSQMDSCAVTSAMFRNLLWGNECCSHSAQHNYPDVSLIIVKPNSSCRQLIVALKEKRPQNNNWPLTIKEEFAWIMSLDFLAIYWQYHSFVSDLENILQPNVSMEISDC